MAVGVMSVGAVFVAPAMAAPGAPAASSTCQVSGSATINPGLTTTPKPQTTKSTGKLTRCTGGSPTTGTFTGAFRGTASCASGTSTGTELVKFTGGKTSTVRGTLKTQGTTATFNGKVVSGYKKGHTVTSKLTFTPQGGANCTTVPVTKASFTGTTTTS